MLEIGFDIGHRYQVLEVGYNLNYKLLDSTTFDELVAENEVRIAELYDIKLNATTTLYFTPYFEDIDWGVGPTTYTSLPINRDEVKAGLNLQADSVDLTLSNVRDEVMELVQNEVLDAAEITIRTIAWSEDYSIGVEKIAFVGTADVEFTRTTVVLNCKSVLSSLNIRVPRNVYQEPCNHTLFDGACGLDRATHGNAGSVLSTTGKAHVLSATVGEQTDGYYDLGELYFTGGLNSGYSRLIRAASGPNAYMAVPFPFDITIGDTFILYPGCDLTPDTCKDRFNNINNYLGFPYIPRPEGIVW